MPQSSPFLQYIADEMYTRRYAKRTIDTYLYWIRFFYIAQQKTAS